MPDIELAFAGQDLRHHRLRADLGQVFLAQAVLLHEEAQYLVPWCIRDGEVLAVVGADQVAHLCGQGCQRVAFGTADLVEQLVEDRDQGVVVRFGLWRSEQGRHVAPMLRRLLQDGAHLSPHFHWLRSYSL
ncbi:hypothetical protein D9M71_793570 [compost metagenome]